ncbi:hypothetical protein DT594_17525 [Halopseudomonas laoshanensis]|uniref:Capsule biosynthesis GfcC-like C-terminal domain-containing protein n=1 Tax=Halopseudomonas laoshanensis TaxID=2268758 RepID=A0A7V7GN67_9GAMM|nr:capsule biosynthesis GfcC family protein [Halopseudomonas laoshanensis]KAA0690823.1 hypothetical protein DT594_17525 [Halopseudomonas laoshanensis]
MMSRIKVSRFNSILAAMAFTLGLAAQSSAAFSADMIEVEISGAVLKPGTYQFERGARLNSAAVAGQVSASAWFLGAALLRSSAIADQTRLKAGILFELKMNTVHAQSNNDDALVALLARYYQAIDAMPVTGRVQTEMDPLSQLFPPNNDLLELGDNLIYPTRPNQVRVIGAVVEDCILPHDGAMQLHDYISDCRPHRLADRDTAYVIQPDGNVSQHGRAYWNLEEANVAVGAVIYVPVREAVLSAQTADLNADVAAMLGTQYQLGGRFDE